MGFTARLFVASAVSALLAIACSSTNNGSGPNPNGNEDASAVGPQCGGFSTGVADCDACFQSACCAWGTACAADQNCSAFANCLSLCNDDTCETQCEATIPNGVDGYNALNDCANAYCADECGIAAPPDDGGLPPATDGSAPEGDGDVMCGGYGSSDLGCNACLDGSCCSQAAACGADATCNALFSCILDCSDQTCVDTCGTTDQAGVTDYNNFIDCMNTNCSDACSGDAGAPPPPPPPVDAGAPVDAAAPFDAGFDAVVSD